MPDGPVVANNTPLAALWSISRLDLLRDLFGMHLSEALIQKVLDLAGESR